MTRATDDVAGVTPTTKRRKQKVYADIQGRTWKTEVMNWDGLDWLWDFQTGYHADGGLRRIYGENGDLVLERFSPEEKSGDCCAKYYIKETYKWNKNVFEKQTEEKFLNPRYGICL